MTTELKRLVMWLLVCVRRYLAGYEQQLYMRDLKKKERSDATLECCPVCGYYCLGKGGVACIDKPTLCGYDLDI